MREQYKGTIINKVEIGRWKIQSGTWDIVYVVVERVHDVEAR